MESWQICGAALVCVVAVVVIKQLKGDFAIPVRLASSLILLGGVIAVGIPLFEYIKSLISNSALAEYAEILLKAFGIALLTHITAEICRDCGENSAASYVELGGKLEIMLLSLPLVMSVLEMATEILNWRI